MIIAEQLVSQTYPVYDYRYRADPDSPFRLYDCLVPTMKKHTKIPKSFLSNDFVQDLKLMIAYKNAQLPLKKDNIHNLKLQLKDAKDLIA